MIQSLRDSRALKLVVDSLAESGLIPRFLLRYRAGPRIDFVRALVPKGSVGAEIGVHKGFFTHAILHHVEPARLHLIDPWYLIGKKWGWGTGNRSTAKALGNVVRWFRAQIASGQVVLHVGFDDQVLTCFPDGYFDWVYLDTSHEYRHTKTELGLLSRKLKPSGIIVGDDWFPDQGHRFYGQYQAITEFVAESDFRVLATCTARHQWAIGRRTA